MCFMWFLFLLCNVALTSSFAQWTLKNWWSPLLTHKYKFLMGLMWSPDTRVCIHLIFLISSINAHHPSVLTDLTLTILFQVFVVLEVRCMHLSPQTGSISSLPVMIQMSISGTVLAITPPRPTMLRAHGLASISSPETLLSRYLGTVWNPVIGSLWPLRLSIPNKVTVTKLESQRSIWNATQEILTATTHCIFRLLVVSLWVMNSSQSFRQRDRWHGPRRNFPRALPHLPCPKPTTSSWRHLSRTPPMPGVKWYWLLDGMDRSDPTRIMVCQCASMTSLAFTRLASVSSSGHCQRMITAPKLSDQQRWCSRSSWRQTYTYRVPCSVLLPYRAWTRAVNMCWWSLNVLAAPSSSHGRRPREVEDLLGLCSAGEILKSRVFLSDPMGFGDILQAGCAENPSRRRRHRCI